MKSFRLTISSPDGNCFDGDGVFLSLRGSEGDLAVMAGHIPFITTVKECDCYIEFEDGAEKVGHISGGLLTVSDEKTVLLSGSFNW